MLSDGHAAPAAPASGASWGDAAASLRRPYRLPFTFVVLMALVPLYLFIPALAGDRPHRAPAMAVDQAIPVVPLWSLVYGGLYLYLIVLPILVVRQERPLRALGRAYLAIWLIAYAAFVAWPTVAPRPEQVVGNGFGAWGLRALYGADPPYNCFPSLHVAHSLVSALACRRVHRGVGAAAVLAALLVAVSTLLTKQHYVLDVVAGLLLAWGACAVFLRDLPEGQGDEDRRVAPLLAAGLFAGIAAFVAVAALLHTAAGFEI